MKIVAPVKFAVIEFFFIRPQYDPPEADKSSEPTPDEHPKGTPVKYAALSFGPGETKESTGFTGQAG